MYFWKIESLKDDIRNNKLDDKAVLPYIVLYIALYSFGIEIIEYLPYEKQNIWDYIFSFFNVLIPVIGTIYTYYKNGGANGNNFLNKYFSISFVIGNRFLVYLIPLIILLGIYWEFTFPDIETPPTTLVEILIFSAWQILFYLNVAKHIESLSKK